MRGVPRLGSGIPLVGRSSQMRQLRSALDRAGNGTAGAVLVSGDAGVGKSRLLDELVTLARGDGAVVLTGRCVDVGETGLPYLPFAEALGPLRDSAAVRSRPALGRLVPGLTSRAQPPASDPMPQVLLADAIPADVAQASGRRRPEHDMGQLQLFEAVLGLLTELAAEGCVLLAIEDLHWADGSTRDLLSFLLARLRLQQLLVVATYRSDDLHRRHPLRPLLAELFRLPCVERLDLEPFGPAHARAFVSALSDGSMPDDAVLRIARRCEGNAFFAEELVAAYSSRGDVMPTALADVLLSRVEELSPAAQRVVRAAAVAGRGVRYEQLPAVLDLPELEVEEALREAVQRNVLVAGDVYTFRHALLAEAVYSDLLPGERVRLHAAYARRLAAAVDERGVAAELAHHSLQSNDLRQALSASVRAAEEAAELGAPGQALGHLEQALKLLDAVPSPQLCCGEDELTLLRRASHAAGSCGEPERAIAYARSAVRLADERGDPEQAAAARHRLAQALVSVDGHEEQATAVIEEALRLLDGRAPSATMAWVLSIRAMIQRWVDDESSRLSAQRAVDTARVAGAAAAEADALVTLAGIELAGGHFDLAIEQLEAARARAVEAGAVTTELRAMFNIGIMWYEDGALDRAVRMFDSAAARAAAGGLTFSHYGIWTRTLQASARYAAGDWDGCLAAAEPPGGSVSGLVSAMLAASRLPVMVGRGDFAASAKLVAQLDAQHHPDSVVQLVTSAAGAELEAWRDRPERALEHAETGLARLRGMWGEKSLPIAGIRLAAFGVGACADLAARARRRRDESAERAAVVAGQRLLDLARSTAEHGRPRADRLGPEAIAWLARAEAEGSRLAGPGDAELWRRVVDGFGYGHVYEQAIARWRLSAALLAVDRRGEAAEQLTAAATTANTLGALPLAKAVRQLARRARITLDGDERVASAGDGAAADLLTPRELSVLGQVALGRTNRQVGEELFISEKTVSVHLSRVMAKLGVGSRTEAVAAAYDRGLLMPEGSQV